MSIDLDGKLPELTGAATASGKFTVTFNIEDDGGSPLGSDALLDCFTTAEFDAGDVTGFATTGDKLSIVAVPVDQWSTATSKTLYTGNYKYGYRFQPLEEITITHLSAYGAGVSQTIELWSVSTGTIIASVTGTFTLNTWEFVALSSSIELDPAEQYTIVGKSEGSGYNRHSSISMVSTAYVTYIDEYYTTSLTGTPTSTTTIAAMVGFRFTYMPAAATWISPAIDVGSYGGDRREITPVLYPSTADIALYWGVSDSDSVAPAAWVAHDGHGEMTDGLPEDLTGKYLYYLITTSNVLAEVEWFGVFDALDRPAAFVRVTFNGEIERIPATGTVDFIAVDEDQTLAYTVDVMPTEVFYTEPVTGSVIITDDDEIETVTVSRIYTIVGVTTTVICSGGGQDIRLIATLPDLQGSATMGSTRTMRTGDYPFTDSAILPHLEFEGSFGHHASLSEDLPALTCSARMGSNASGNLPYLEMEATGSAWQSARLAKNLPTLSLVASMGSHLDAKLPVVLLEATASTPVLMRLNKTLPVLSLVATISGASGSLEKSLPVLSLDATMSRRNSATLDKKLPTLRLVATVKSGATASLEATLPELRIVAESNSAVINLNAYLPALTTGTASGTMTTQGNVMSGSRFDGTLLRHARWA